MPMKTAQEYIDSLRELKTRVYMFGEQSWPRTRSMPT